MKNINKRSQVKVKLEQADQAKISKLIQSLRRRRVLTDMEKLKREVLVSSLMLRLIIVLVLRIKILLILLEKSMKKLNKKEWLNDKSMIVESKHHQVSSLLLLKYFQIEIQIEEANLLLNH